MLRALLLLAAFSLISPSLRHLFLSSFALAQQQIELHTTIAMVGTGMLCFVSVMWIRLTGR